QGSKQAPQRDRDPQREHHVRVALLPLAGESAPTPAREAVADEVEGLPGAWAAPLGTGARHPHGDHLLLVLGAEGLGVERQPAAVATLELTTAIGHRVTIPG